MFCDPGHFQSTPKCVNIIQANDAHLLYNLDIFLWTCPGSEKMKLIDQNLVHFFCWPLKSTQPGLIDRCIWIVGEYGVHKTYQQPRGAEHPVDGWWFLSNIA